MRRAILLLTLLATLALPAAARADDLPVGDHNDTVQELDDVNIVREVGQARLSAFDVGVSATGLPTTWCGSETTSDYTASPTFSPALPQFKVVYAYPSDRPDRFAQWQDALQANLSLIEQLVSSQPGSTRAPRFDMGTACGPEYLDIQTVALPGARSSYVQNMGAVESYVKTRLNPSPGGRRNYLIIADTMSGGGLNGVGELYEGSPSSERPDLANVHNNGGLTSVMWAPDTGAPGANPNGWWPEGLLHEMTHNMGGVQWSAPHTSQPAGGRSYQYSHCWDGRDVMCYQDGPSPGHAYSTTVCAALAGAMPQTYDCGQDDYFNPAPPAGSYLATHWNVYDNVFMAECSSMPADTCLGSGPIGPPVNTAAPTFSGSTVTGAVLTGAPGSWSPAGRTYTYQWERDPGSGYVGVTGASASTYRLATADRGATMRLKVTATSPYGAVNAWSDPAGPVLGQPPINTVAPSISGTTTNGSTLTGSIGAWSPAGTTYAYQWQRNAGAGWIDIPGATTNTRRLSLDDRATTLHLRVRATNADGTATATSAPVGPVTVPTPVNASLPTILGAAKNGVTLTATTGAWSPGATYYAYQWQRDAGAGFVNLAGAIASTYRLVSTDKGARIRVRVHANNRDAGVLAFSAPTAVVVAQPPVNTVAPRLIGVNTVGATLTGTTGTWSPPGTSYSYQWQRDAGVGFVSIAGATRTTYKLLAADRGANLRFRVQAANVDGMVTAYSPPTALVRVAAGSATVSAGASSSVRSAGGVAMASATVSANGAFASAASARPRLTVTVRRSARAHGRLRVVACPAPARDAPAEPCTRPRALGRGAVALQLAAASGRVQITLLRAFTR